MKKALRLLALLVVTGCTHTSINEQLPEDLSGIPLGSSLTREYPPFYTPTNQYYIYE